MNLFKKIRKTYYTLQQKIACWDKRTIKELEIKANPFGDGTAEIIREYCPVTGDYLKANIIAKDFKKIKRDIEGLFSQSI